MRQLFAGGRLMIEARWPSVSLENLWSRDRWVPPGITWDQKEVL